MRIFSRVALASGGALLLTLAAVPLVQANEGTTPSDDSMSKQVESEARHRAEVETKARAAAEKAKLEEATRTKLAAATKDAKKNICEKRQKFVDASMDRLTKRSTKQIQLLDTMSTRIQAYATNKKLTVDNYDGLLSDVAAKKAAAETNITALQEAKTAFKCDGDNPKAAATAYQTALRSTNKAIKDYRDSVKKLLVAVKQSQKDTPKTEEKQS